MRARECSPPTAVALREADFEPGSEAATAFEASMGDVGRRLSLCADEAVERIGELGLLGSGVVRSREAAELSADRGVLQGRVFIRGDGVTLAMRLGPDGFRAGFELSVAQGRAARELARTGAVRLRIARALEALPDPFMVGTKTGDAAPGGTGSRGRGRPRAMGAALERVLRAERTPWVGVGVARAEVVARGGLPRATVVEALVVVAHLGALLVPVSDPREVADTDASVPSLDLPAGQASPPGARPEEPSGATPFARGSRVRIIAGPFAGRVGFVHDLDGKGGGRVVLGLLTVKFDIANLTADGERRRRPVLGTSHRKPVPARS